MSDNGLRAFESVMSLIKTLAICATIGLIGWVLCNEVRQAKEEITAIKNRLTNPFGG